MDRKEDLRKLSKDLYYNRNLEFEGVSGQDAMRKLILEQLGGEFSITSWQKHKYDVFEIISVAVDAVVPALLTDTYQNLADIRNVSIGTKPLFKVQNADLIRVGRIASGANDMRRQTITGRNFTIETDWYGVSVYAEFEQYLAGDIDWNKLVDKVALSLNNHLEMTIANAIQASYGKLGAKYQETGLADFDKLVHLATQVQARSGKTVAIYGTKTALAKVAKLAGVQMFSGNMKDEMNQHGFLGVVGGLKLIEIPQVLKANSDEFAIDDTTLLVLPEGEKIVGVVFEGDSMTVEPDNMGRNDMQLGFETMRKMGVSVLQMAIYGYAKLS